MVLMGHKQQRKLLGYRIICCDQITFQHQGTGNTRLEIQSKEAGLGGRQVARTYNLWATGQEPGSNEGKGKLRDGTGGQLAGGTVGANIH